MHSTPAVAANPAQAAVRLALLRAHYAQIPAMAIAPTAGGLFSAWVLWGTVQNRYLVIGMAAVTLLSGLRLLLYRHYFKLAPERAAQRRWYAVAVVSAGISGCIWGSVAPFLYPPQAPGHEVFLVVLLTLLPIVPVSALASYPPALYAYFIPCTVPFVATLALQDSRGEKMAALLLLMMMGAMLTFARRYSQSLAEATLLRVQLAGQSQALQTAVQQKAQFIAAAGHDLRQPVHAMSLFLASLRDSADRTQDAPMLGHLEASLANLRSMLGNMLDISKLDAEVLGPQMQDVALDVLLARLADEHRPLAAQKGLAFRTRLAPAVVCSDPLLLERIVRNLLANALKYTDRGGVALVCRGHAAGWRLQVVDTGVGIAAGDIATVFQPFRQLGNRERSDANGLGLGLAIVQRMALLLGHPLRVRSTPGRGTVFTLDLPRGTGPLPAAPAPAATSATTPAARPLPDMPAGWVMVIDDDAAVGAAAGTLLRQWGHRVSVCATADDALAVLHTAADSPQLLLVDLRLAGGQSGLDAVALIHQHLQQAVPVILITGDTAPERIRHAYDAGHVLLHKPVDPQRLRLCLAELCPPPGQALTRAQTRP